VIGRYIDWTTKMKTDTFNILLNLLGSFSNNNGKCMRIFLALTSPTSGGRSVGIVRWRTKAPEFVFVWRRIFGGYTM
jgi:hypothetical protein